MHSNLGVFEEEERQALEALLVHTRIKARNFANTKVKNLHPGPSRAGKQTMRAGRIRVSSTM